MWIEDGMREQYVDRRWNESSMWIGTGMRDQYVDQSWNERVVGGSGPE
jgi:hypothetical protein